jgi:hypothetical protein
MTLALPELPDFSQTETFYIIAQWWDRHTQVVFPTLVVLSLIVLLTGIIQAFRSEDLRGTDRVELKREVLVAVRRHPGGVAAEQLSKDTGIQTRLLVKLLEDMQRIGWVTCFTNTQRLTLWTVQETRPQRRSRSN